MKNIYIVGALGLALAGVVGLGAMSVSAMHSEDAVRSGGTHREYGKASGSGYQKSLESRAAVLGMNASELEEALKTKTMSQIAVDQGLNEETFREKMQAAAKERWASRGLSAEQIQERLAEREQRYSENSADHEFGSGEGQHRGGYGQNR